MATLTIRSTSDISRTRNVLRKLILAHRCSPTLAARSAAAVGILTESILQVGVSIYLDVGIVLRGERRTVEMGCDISLTGTAALQMQELQDLLVMAVNDVQMGVKNNRLSISMRLW